MSKTGGKGEVVWAAGLRVEQLPTYVIWYRTRAAARAGPGLTHSAIVGRPVALKEIMRQLIKLKEIENTNAFSECTSERRVAVAIGLYQEHIAVRSVKVIGRVSKYRDNCIIYFIAFV